ncbi:MAG: 50S ribosomal protein L4 [Candidatus Pacebacteria bacterium]|nr:50S ribosomal protein L4 [Candidatus Paceibacterota bacterium]
MKASIYNNKGKETGSMELPVGVFGAKRNSALVHQVVTAMAANARTPVAHTKGRGEVRGGGKKPYAQKGTGQARHGSIRSPIWRGGGTTHGPLKEKVYAQKINKKMRDKALATVISDKVRSSRLMLVDALPFAGPKTKDARTVLTALGSVKGYEEVGTRRKNAVLFALATKDATVIKSFRNMTNVMVEEARNLNVMDVLKYRYLVIVNPEESVKKLADRIS